MFFFCYKIKVSEFFMPSFSIEFDGSNNIFFFLNEVPVLLYSQVYMSLNYCNMHTCQPFKIVHTMYRFELFF